MPFRVAFSLSALGALNKLASMSLHDGVDCVDFGHSGIFFGGALVPIVDAFCISCSASSFIAKSLATAKSYSLSFGAVVE